MNEHEAERLIHSALPSLEDDLIRNVASIDRRLGNHYAESPDEMLIDAEIELQNPREQFAYIMALMSTLGGQTEGQFIAAYSAYHFAIRVADMLGWRVPAPAAAMHDLSYLLQNQAGADEAKTLIEGRVNQYLDERPELASVIDGYVTDYAQQAGRTFDDEAQIVCALTFERIEQFCIGWKLTPHG